MSDHATAPVAAERHTQHKDMPPLSSLHEDAGVEARTQENTVSIYGTVVFASWRVTKTQVGRESPVYQE